MRHVLPQRSSQRGPGSGETALDCLAGVSHARGRGLRLEQHSRHLEPHRHPHDDDAPHHEGPRDEGPNDERARDADAEDGGRAARAADDRVLSLRQGDLRRGSPGAVRVLRRSHVDQHLLRRLRGRMAAATDQGSAASRGTEPSPARHD